MQGASSGPAVRCGVPGLGAVAVLTIWVVGVPGIGATCPREQGCGGPRDRGCQPNAGVSWGCGPVRQAGTPGLPRAQLSCVLFNFCSAFALIAHVDTAGMFCLRAQRNGGLPSMNAPSVTSARGGCNVNDPNLKQLKTARLQSKAKKMETNHE